MTLFSLLTFFSLFLYTDRRSLYYQTKYSPAAGTAYVTFDNVKVPVENTLGPENGGLVCPFISALPSHQVLLIPFLHLHVQLVILSNFNHVRTSRLALSRLSSMLIVVVFLPSGTMGDVLLLRSILKTRRRAVSCLG